MNISNIGTTSPITRLHGSKAARVLDPFMGTGTTLVAAALEGATATGIDLDQLYVETAAARLAETLAQIASTKSEIVAPMPTNQISERTLAASAR